MKYRKLPKLGIEVSAFGVGCMRFPMKKNENGVEVVDEAISTPVIRHAIDQGVNYFDTAYVYSGGHKNEIALGHALRDGYREKVCIATKLPVWQCQSRADMDRILDESLRNLGVDCIDFYLLHSLDREEFDRTREQGALQFLDDAKAAGKIKYACFSFHDNAEAFRHILDAYAWDMCQIQMNFMDINHQATLAGMQYAGQRGVPVVIMEGLLGGKLAKAPANVQALYDAFPVRRSAVEWAFRWLCSHPEIATVLSGVTSMEQCDDNLAIFDRCEPGCMTPAEEELIARVREAYESRTKVGCTGCRYCMPCPNGVDIPRLFSTWNDLFLYDEPMQGSGRYKKIIADGCDASKCLSCGSCEEACPQHISIMEMLRQADAELRDPVS